MFKKINRLSTNFEFNITRKYGKKMSGALFTLFLLKPEKYTGPVKFGIVVSNKIHKSAAKRNILKRRFREAIRTAAFTFPGNLWVVVHPKSISLEKTYEEISTDVNQVLSKVHIS